MSDIELQSDIEIWPIERIIPFEKNAKIHDEDQVSKIAASIRLSGFNQPIYVDKNGVIIKGHGRRLAALKLGLKRIPVIVSPNSDEVNAADRLADNRVAQGKVDFDLLNDSLAGFNVDLLGGIFDKKELDFFLEDAFKMDMDVIADDLTAAVDLQKATLESSIGKSAEKTVSIASALKFKSIPLSESVYVTRLMAKLEGESGLPPDQAFLAFVKEHVSVN